MSPRIFVSRPTLTLPKLPLACIGIPKAARSFAFFPVKRGRKLKSIYWLPRSILPPPSAKTPAPPKENLLTFATPFVIVNRPERSLNRVTCVGPTPAGRALEARAWSRPFSKASRSTPLMRPFNILKSPPPLRDFIIAACERPLPWILKALPISPDAFEKPAAALKRLSEFTFFMLISRDTEGTELDPFRTTFILPAPPYNNKLGRSATIRPSRSAALIVVCPKDIRLVTTFGVLNVKRPLKALRGAILIGASLQG